MDGEKSEERIKMPKFDFFLSLKADDEFGEDESTSWVLVFLCAIIIWMMMTIMMVIFSLMTIIHLYQAQCDKLYK